MPRPFPVDPDPDVPAPTAAEIPGFIEAVLTSAAAPEVLFDAEVRLRRAGRMAEPALLGALDDPRAMWFDPLNPDGIPPGARLAKLLDVLPSRALGDKLLPLADQAQRRPETWWIDRLVPLAVSSLGREDVLPLVLIWISNPDSRWITALEGVDRSIRLGWAEPGFIDRILEWSATAAFEPQFFFYRSWAMKFYARHGGPRALARLQHPDVLSLENKHGVCFAIRELTRHRVVIAESTLEPFFTKSLSSGEGPWPYDFGILLDALALSNPHSARRRALERLEAPTDGASETLTEAAEHIWSAEGLPSVGEWWPPEDMALDESERNVLQDLWVWRCVASDVVESWELFASNCGPGCWKIARDVLNAVGAQHSVRALVEAASILDPEGCGLVEGQPAKLRTDLSDAESSRIRDLASSIHYDAWKGGTTLKYLLRHKDLFVRIKHARAAAGLDRPDPSWEDGC